MHDFIVEMENKIQAAGEILKYKNVIEYNSVRLSDILYGFHIFIIISINFSHLILSCWVNAHVVMSYHLKSAHPLRFNERARKKL